MKKFLFALCAFVLLSWASGSVENTLAHPSGHSHKHIFSQSEEHQHSIKHSEAGNFDCPMKSHHSLMPCPHKHSQKDMAHPKQCKISPDCGGSPFKSVPVNLGIDYNPAWTLDGSPPDIPERLLPYDGLSMTSHP